MSTPGIPPEDCPCGKAQTCYECTHPPSEREKVLENIPDVLICQSLPNENGFCGKNDCFCKELHRVESGDICKWMQGNRLRQQAGEQ